MMTIDLAADTDRDLAAFGALTGTDLAARTAARMRARGLAVEWCEVDAGWQARSEKVGCFTDRGIFRHTEYTAHADIQGITPDGVEVIVRVRVARLGKGGNVTAEILVGAYVGGGRDPMGRMVEPRFLCASANAPEVAAARRAMGLD